jgi:methyl-accepting chemotaxis protein
MKRDKSTIILFVCLFFIPKQIAADNVLSDIHDEAAVDLFILESSLDEGKYITGDIREFDFTKYDGKNLPKEKDVERRMYTFLGEFFIDGSLKQENLALHFGPSDYPYNIYINGIKVFTSGFFENGYNSSNYNSPNIFLSQDYLKYGEEKNQVAVQIYPKYETSPLASVTILSYNKGSLKSFFRDLFNVHLIQGSSLIALILFLYFLFLFFAHRCKEQKYLFFSLTCLFIIFSYFNISFSNNMVDQVIHEKMSRCGFPLTAMSLLLFIIEYTKTFKAHKRLNFVIKCIVAAPALIIAFIIALQNSKQMIHGMFDSAMMFVILPTLLFSFVLLIRFVFISLREQRSYSSLAVFMSFIMIIITSSHDMYNVMNSLTPYAWTVPYGYLIMVLSIFFSLSLEQSQIYIQSENNRKEVEEKNISLKKMMENISYVAGNLVESSSRLNDHIEKSMSIIQNNRETNKQMLEKMMKQFENIELIINQVDNRIVSSSQRIPKAINHQTDAVGDVNNIMSRMKEDIEATSISSVETSNTANKLANIADESSKIVTESKKTINTITEYSDFINQILSSIEDITEKTNLLSINASIEAANSGSIGKGFSVIANEIRNLAAKSKKNLDTSFENLNSMKNIIKKSNQLADDVYTRLFNIINESKLSALKINHITELIEQQKNQSINIMQSVESLLNDTVEINKLCEEEQRDDEKIQSTLVEFKNSFETIGSLFKEQEEKENELYTSITSIKEVMNENLKNVDILNASL